MSTNPQLELAYEFVRHTDKNIFLTGKAGTGKTTFLHRIKKEAVKRMAVVAPTGVAAINAGGMTIHSLFQLPFGPLIPGAKVDARQRRFSKKKISLLRSLDLLVIDEISMVRADLLDGIDDVLRRYRRNSKPFGGVQLLMIGDLNQLPPVVKQEEWGMLSQYYQTAYFFGSLALQKSDPVTIELKHIYRQSDEKFIGLLNKVRDNVLDESVLSILNSRYRENFTPPEKDGYITLTSHNAAAQKINQERLKALKSETKKFKARIDGDFPAHAFPTDEELELKIGAQVMFVKNDPNQEKLFFNGKIGQVVRFGDDAIYVKCPDDAEEIAVTALEWNNTKYKLNEKTKEVESDTLGTFTQYPLKLAWAITIHKSQGLTFERAIIDAELAFAHGQVYVALSRCKSFDGIVLRSKISFSSVKTDHVVKNYNEEAEKNAPDETALENSKKEFQQKLILELFDFTEERRAIGLFNRLLMEKSSSFQGGAFDQLQKIKEKAETDIFSVADKFRPHLLNYFRQSDLPESNSDLQARIKKASIYFFEKLENEIKPLIGGVKILTDNQAVHKKATERLNDLKNYFFVKTACLKLSQKGFSATTYLRTKANADLDYSKQLNKSSFSSSGATTSTPGLYSYLNKWRNEIAQKEGCSAYDVLPLSSLLEITRKFPRSSDDLKRIKGMGEVKIKKYGGQLLQLLDEHAKGQGAASPFINSSKGNRPSRGESRRKSFEMFHAGKSIDEIAKERGLVRSTIEGHLAYFVGQGELDIFKLMEKESVEEIMSFIENEDVEKNISAKDFFKDKYSYSELRMVRVYRTWKKEEELKSEVK